MSRATGVIVPAGEDANLLDGVTLETPEGGAFMETRVFVQDQLMWESVRIEFPGIDSYVDVTTRVAGADHANSDGSRSRLAPAKFRELPAPRGPLLLMFGAEFGRRSAW